MKKTMRYISMAALALMGAITAGCSSDDSIEQQLEKGGAVALKTTVSLGAGDITRALSADGSEKTFAVGDKIAIVYENKDDQTVKAESDALTADDIATGGKTATFSVVLTSPKAGGSVKYVYPAAKANNDGTVNNSALATQDGTMAYIGENCDVALFEGSMTSEARLPAQPTLTNQLAIYAFTIYNADGSSDITSTITAMTVSDGTNSYAVSRTAAAGPIYVAIKPVANATIEYTATDGTNKYEKSVTGKTYSAGDLLPIGLKMIPATTDLSMVDCAGNARSKMWTANCYMVHKKGAYKLPLVYGNAIEGGQTNAAAYTGVAGANTTATFPRHDGQPITGPWIKDNGITVTQAELLWQDAQGLITAVGIDGDYLTLTVGKDATEQQGNALIAAKDAGGKIVWSWHIWVTKETFADATLTTIATGDHTYKVTPVNLGWVPTSTDGKQGYNTYYQWGRKDPFKAKGAPTDKTVYNIDGAAITGMTYTNYNSITIGDNIQNPTTFYYKQQTNSPCNTQYYNMWDAQQGEQTPAVLKNITTATVKTVYDPCPAGFCVPTSNLFSFMGKGVDVSTDVQERNDTDWDDTNKGKTWKQATYSTNTTGPDLYFPAVGYRYHLNGTFTEVGTTGPIWSASPDDQRCGRSLVIYSPKWQSTFMGRIFGNSVRAVAESITIGPVGGESFVDDGEDN